MPARKPALYAIGVHETSQRGIFRIEYEPMFEFINSSRPVCGIEQRYAAQEMQRRIRRPDFDRIREVLRSAAMADGGGLAKQLV